jgi:hypothetical protein
MTFNPHFQSPFLSSQGTFQMSSQQLITAKYWHAVLQQEQAEILRERNRQALRSFGLSLFTVAVMIGVFFAIQTMPQWLPHAIDFADSCVRMPAMESKI